MNKLTREKLWDTIGKDSFESFLEEGPKAYFRHRVHACYMSSCLLAFGTRHLLILVIALIALCILTPPSTNLAGESDSSVTATPLLFAAIALITISVDYSISVGRLFYRDTTWSLLYVGLAATAAFLSYT
ncbi:MAG: hypothetical protein V5A84_02195, partial [Planctomycetota bacterium]